MTVPILCLASLCLLMWVVMLKLEIARLQERGAGKHKLVDSSARSGSSRVSGMRNFDIKT